MVPSIRKVRAPKSWTLLRLVEGLLSCILGVSIVLAQAEGPERTSPSEVEGSEGPRSKIERPDPPEDLAGSPEEGRGDAEGEAAEGDTPPERDEGRAAERREEATEDGETEEAILQALWTEMDFMAERIRSIRERLDRISRGTRDSPLRESPLPRPAPDAPRADRRPRDEGPERPPWLEKKDLKRYELLIVRQTELVRKFRDLEGREERPGRELRGPEARKTDRDAIRSELRQVLLEILELREKGRERQLEMLRREIEELERVLDSRRDESARKKMVESRLEDLLRS